MPPFQGSNSHRTAPVTVRCNLKVLSFPRFALDSAPLHFVPWTTGSENDALEGFCRMKRGSIFPIGISGPWSYRSEYFLVHFLKRMYIFGHHRTPISIMRPNRTGSARPAAPHLLPRFAADFCTLDWERTR